LNEPFASFLQGANEFAKTHGLTSARGSPLQFVAQDALSAQDLAMGYEAFIAQTGAVPTRDLRHDRLNALVWLSASRSKRRLNALHEDALLGSGLEAQTCDTSRTKHLTTAKAASTRGSRGGRGGSGGRGALRDALTLLDENLMVIACHAQGPELKALLEDHDWQALFWQFRARWQNQWQPFVFGHALLEKLDAPFKAITAHCLLLYVRKPVASWQDLDEMLCAQLGPDLRSSHLLALPVMGLAGWCPENTRRDFYFDPKVFRAKRPPQAEVEAPGGLGQGPG
jgi:hypothetical protein